MTLTQARREHGIALRRLRAAQRALDAAAERLRQTEMKTAHNRLRFNGKCMSIRQWAKRIGLHPTSLSSRLQHGWPLERALKTRRGVFGPKAK